ncbi:translesion DNA synthesis-associated protein ImuA [Pusillimonas sp. SM2304]|uniref:translesion DNA synthesis-associated protein ImuA n=1 Tax=Pusillimonas sp. SM2304 TaxID=3073241 RepID=UPI00287401A5|nr:translesion DNA synthesis-associated protein ImuA [Pusillimonas sp. SM2304]MDS1141631.1 translesion DNA synthesis-associated protein ImuA [Pusillimonas sp. SM2304]
MAVAVRPACLQHPERIHPAVWRATQLACSSRSAISTGFAALDAELPGRGWPPGALIELMPSQPGIGEIFLLQPALARLDAERSIALVHPPYIPYFHCWKNWRLENHRLLCIHPQSASDALWATEQILKHNACAAVVCWASHVRLAALRRLHLIAQQADALFVLLRPQAAAQQASAAPLRLRLTPCPQGIKAHIVKRRGPCSAKPVLITFPSAQAKPSALPHHVPLDQPVSAHAQPGRLFSAVAD